MNTMKRAVSVWLTVVLLSTAMAIAPAASIEPDARVDSLEDVEAALEDVLEEVPALEALVKGSSADVADLTIDEAPKADIAVEFQTDNGTRVGVPTDASDPIELDSARGADIEIVLPGNADDAKVTEDGSVVYENALTDTDIVVQAQADGGVRILTVIDGAGAPRSFNFETVLDRDESVVLLDDGSAIVTDVDGELIAQVPVAWAYDANGVEVPSWYSIRGDTLVLNVDHSSTSAYPVIADPVYRRTWYGLETWKFNRSETWRIQQALSGATTVAGVAAAFCAGFTVGVCTAPWLVAWALIGLGANAIRICRNSRGFDLHRLNGALWCSGY